MNLFAKLNRRAETGKPIRIGMIGAGKFGSMFLAQLLKLPAIHLVGVADLSPANARSNMSFVGWSPERFDAAGLDEAARSGKTFVGDDAGALVAHPAVEIVVECTGNPIAAVEHCLMAFRMGKHVVNVTVEADAFCGPALAARAAEAGVIYSMAYGDQPALVCDLVDWARTCGFTVVAAGRGHKWLPHYRQSTPETVWDHWGLTPEQAERGRLNPKMFNAFLDGSKPAIECAAIANATGLDVPSAGLAYPPGSAEDIPTLMRPAALGGRLEREGLVEAISCLTPEGKPIPYDIRNGVWVCFRGDTDYVRNCFEEYKVLTDETGRYAALYKRWHLIGLELAVSVASVGLRGEATGVAAGFRGDVSAIAKRNLKAGEILDGEGGSTVSGGLRPAEISVPRRYLPLGLAQKIKLIRSVRDGEPVTYDDVEVDSTSAAFRLRQDMEAKLRG
jgi:predicted homoserine dehydrogenase-like protein